MEAIGVLHWGIFCAFFRMDRVTKDMISLRVR
jgi:hypothetical protein